MMTVSDGALHSDIEGSFQWQAAPAIAQPSAEQTSDCLKRRGEMLMQNQAPSFAAWKRQSEQKRAHYQQTAQLTQEKECQDTDFLRRRFLEERQKKLEQQAKSAAHERNASTSGMPTPIAPSIGHEVMTAQHAATGSIHTQSTRKKPTKRKLEPTPLVPGSMQQQHMPAHMRMAPWQVANPAMLGFGRPPMYPNGAQYPAAYGGPCIPPGAQANLAMMHERERQVMWYRQQQLLLQQQQQQQSHQQQQQQQQHRGHMGLNSSANACSAMPSTSSSCSYGQQPSAQPLAQCSSSTSAAPHQKMQQQQLDQLQQQQQGVGRHPMNHVPDLAVESPLSGPPSSGVDPSFENINQLLNGSKDSSGDMPNLDPDTVGRILSDGRSTSADGLLDEPSPAFNATSPPQNGSRVQPDPDQPVTASGEFARPSTSYHSQCTYPGAISVAQQASSQCGAFDSSGSQAQSTAYGDGAVQQSHRQFWPAYNQSQQSGGVPSYDRHNQLQMEQQMRVAYWIEHQRPAAVAAAPPNTANMSSYLDVDFNVKQSEQMAQQLQSASAAPAAVGQVYMPQARPNVEYLPHRMA